MLSCLLGKKVSKSDTPHNAVEGAKKVAAGAESNAAHRKKYFIVVRHGERIDETFPELTQDRGDEYWDTGITERGKVHSRETGASIMKILDELGVLDQMVKKKEHEGKTSYSVRKIRFVSSIFYRCLQTTQEIRAGMNEYLQSELQKVQSASPELSQGRPSLGSPQASQETLLPPRACTLSCLQELLKSRSTHTEEACSEKIAGVQLSAIHKLRIEKNREATLKEFADLNIVTGELFDYQDAHKHLTLWKVFNKSSDVYHACADFYRRIIRRLLDSPNHDIYILVAHGMYVQVLMWFLQVEAAGGRKVRYNSTSVLEYDLEEAGAEQDCLPTPRYIKLNEVIHSNRLV
jgi:broad specificity phosphatase PhoE